MKKGWILFLVFLLTLFAVGCSTGQEDEESLKLLDEGYIVEMDQSGKRILVTEKWKGPGHPHPQAAWLTVGEETHLSDQQRPNMVFEDLRIGWMVEVWHKGPVAESYPIQAEAARVLVQENGNESMAIAKVLDHLKEKELTFIQEASYDQSRERWTVRIAELGSARAFDVNLNTGDVEEQEKAQGPKPEPTEEPQKEPQKEPDIRPPVPANPQIVAENEAFRIFQPAPDTVVGKTLTVSGEARVFEAMLSYSLEDGHTILAEGHAQASKGAPDWGSFEIHITLDGVTSPAGVLSIFELSAKDGSPRNVLRIPVTFKEELLNQ